MKKCIFSLLAVMLSLSVWAKEDIDPKYAEGAVPVDGNGSVYFTSTVDIPSDLSQDDCYKMVFSWAKGRFAQPTSLEGRILSENAESRRFVFYVKQMLTFKRTGLVADEAVIEYNFSVTVGEKSVTATMSDIVYHYEEEREGGGQSFTAEEWITDDEAYNAKHTKFYKKVAKFRIKTIDMKDRLFDSMSQSISGN